mmetsp:Transcript_26916/g.62366  ORF Transcript_26916/g.62366 Transcript_26916/m.62366 type:complete len:252 (-) Transcript_26916:191-946(-)
MKRKGMAVAWDLEEIEKRSQGEKTAILVMTGALNPPHLGHIDAMRQAKEALECAGHKVVGAFLSPSHDDYVRSKRRGIPYNAQVRCEMVRAMCRRDNSWIAVGEWESSPLPHGEQWYERRDFGDVCDHLTAAVEDKFGADEGHDVWYVCGVDHWDRNVSRTSVPNVVVVQRHTTGSQGTAPGGGVAPRANRPPIVSKPRTPPSTFKLSSTHVQSLIAGGDLEGVRECVGGDAYKVLEELECPTLCGGSRND